MISVEDFDTFVNEVHGPTVVDGRPEPRRAFPWQSALLQRVLDEGWPATIDVPTGLGKTSVIDVAVFAAALRPDRAPGRVRAGAGPPCAQLKNSRSCARNSLGRSAWIQWPAPAITTCSARGNRRAISGRCSALR